MPVASGHSMASRQHPAVLDVGPLPGILQSEVHLALHAKAPGRLLVLVGHGIFAASASRSKAASHLVVTEMADAFLPPQPGCAALWQLGLATHCQSEGQEAGQRKET